MAEQAAIRAFLANLLDGATLVLLGSRGSAQWLRPNWKVAEAELVEAKAGQPLASTGSASGWPTATPAPLRDIDIYPLPGLDAGAGADLAERILTRQVADETKRRAYAADPAFTRLIKLLDGSPLALEVVLSNLARQRPEEIVAALAAGDVRIDDRRPTTDDAIAERRTQSILASIAYSHSNLSPQAQQLLLCLAPFTGVINRAWLPQYSAQLQQQPALGDLPFERWDEVVDEAINWGLLVPDGQLDGYLRVQPILPYFLRTRLHGQAEVYSAIENGFRNHYGELGSAFAQLLTAKDPNQKQFGKILTSLEYENLFAALKYSLAANESISSIYVALDEYIDVIQAHLQGIAVGEYILSVIEEYELKTLSDSQRFDLLRILGDLGRRYNTVHRYTEANNAYERILQLIDTFTDRAKKQKGLWKATTYHNLGVVAQEQRAWAQAEAHYQQALALFIEFNDRYSQARTYHGLGMVAQEQRAWAQAEAHYQQALAIYVEFNDRYSQASTYHQLGRVAEEQEQWDQAREYHLLALTIAVEYNDEYRIGTRLQSLARLHRAGGDATLPAAVAGVLGVDVATVEARFAEVLGADEDEA